MTNILSSDYLYNSIFDCKAGGVHLTECDDDGYCDYCGHQDFEDDEYEDDDC